MTALALNKKAIDMSWAQDREIIAVVCDKGGVGKSSFVAGLGAALAQSGSRVLCIDMNKQGNLSQDLGIPAAVDEYGQQLVVGAIPVFGDGGEALSRAIINSQPLAPVEVPGRPGLSICVGGPHFSRVKRYMASVGENEAPTVLAVSLRQIFDQFDYILIDSPPEDEDMLKAVLAAARWAICPTKTDSSSLLGLVGVAAVYGEIVEEYNPYLELLGSFIFGTSMTDSGKAFQECRDQQQTIMGSAGAACPHGVPHVERVANQSRAWGMPVTELESKAIEEGWTLSDINSIARVAKAWLKVIAFFQAELACRRAGHPAGLVKRVDLEIDEKTGNVVAITPVYNEVETLDEDAELSA